MTDHSFNKISMAEHEKKIAAWYTLDYLVLWAIMALTICNDSRESEFYGSRNNYAHIHILIAFWKSRGHLNKGSTHLLEIVFESRVR